MSQNRSEVFFTFHLCLQRSSSKYVKAKLLHYNNNPLSMQCRNVYASDSCCLSFTQMGKAQCCQESADCMNSSDKNTQYGRRSQHNYGQE